MSMQDKPVVFGTEDLLLSLCNSVSAVLSKATRGEIRNRCQPLALGVYGGGSEPDSGLLGGARNTSGTRAETTSSSGCRASRADAFPRRADRLRPVAGPRGG